jgi:hypothetical protein
MKYVSPTKPMKQQTEYLSRLRKRPKNPSSEDVMAVRGEMGTGKTKMVLDEWQDMVSAGTVDDLLVIAPAGSYKNWYMDKSDAQPSELKAHLDPRLLKKVHVTGWTSGGGVETRKRIEYMLKLRDAERPRAFFMNIEALGSTDKAVDAAVKFLTGRRVMMVVDESTRIKSGKAQRTKAIIKELKPLATARRIMTGMISPKSPLDVFWQFYFLDWKILGFESPVAFRSRYAVVERQCFLPNELIRGRLRSAMGLIGKTGTAKIRGVYLKKKLKIVREVLGQRVDTINQMNDATIIRKLGEEASIMGRDHMVDLIPKLGSYLQVTDKIKSFRNLPELREKMAPYSHVVLKKDCLDLKPKIFMPRDVQLTDEQKHLYREIKNNAFVELEEGYVNADSVIKRMLRLHQLVCGHVVDEESKKIIDVPSNRVQEILDITEEHAGKAIIWATYQHEIKKIAAALKKEYGPKSVAMFYGGNKKTRGQDEINFLSDPECRWMVSTQSAGGIGNTWNVADLTIYAANSYDLELRAQSEDRNHRKGQTKAVTYVDLIVRGSVEEVIVKALRKKIDLSAEITGENYGGWLI